jgi:hypothetical protein
MTELVYVPANAGAGWCVFAHGSVVLAIELPVDSPRVPILWALIRSGANAPAILDELVSAGMAALPSFALVGGDDPAALVALVRGSAKLATVGSAGGTIVEGAGISSWVERVVDGSTGFELWPAEVDTAAPTLPLASGIVRARAVRSGQLAGVPEPVPVAPPVAEPSVTPPPAEPAVTPPPATITPPLPAPAPPTVEALAPAADAPVEHTLASSTVITVPDRTSAPPEATPAAQVPPAPPSEPSGYDHLFGATVMRDVEDAAVRESSETTTTRPEPAGSDGDHDGHTVAVADIAALRARRRAQRSTPAAPEPSGPRYGVELSTGGTEPLDQPIVIGRAPSASRVPGDQLPRLVSMTTPNQDISRTHAQVSAQGGAIVVTDLHSSNGTIVTLPGKPAQRLRPGEPTTVIVGTIIDLGDGATLTVRELP